VGLPSALRFIIGIFRSWGQANSYIKFAYSLATRNFAKYLRRQILIILLYASFVLYFLHIFENMFFCKYLTYGISFAFFVPLCLCKSLLGHFYVKSNCNAHSPPSSALLLTENPGKIGRSRIPRCPLLVSAGRLILGSHCRLYSQLLHLCAGHMRF
jgi:hypothetical protein